MGTRWARDVSEVDKGGRMRPGAQTRANSRVAGAAEAVRRVARWSELCGGESEVVVVSRGGAPKIYNTLTTGGICQAQPLDTAVQRSQPAIFINIGGWLLLPPASPTRRFNVQYAHEDAEMQVASLESYPNVHHSAQLSCVILRLLGQGSTWSGG